MDKFYHEQIDEFVETFKKEVKKNFVEKNENESMFNEFVDNYDSFKISSTTPPIPTPIITNKKSIPDQFRCNAKRLNNEQCTRRRNKISIFCGTHCKAQPFGLFDSILTQENIKHTILVYTRDIQGIVFHLDMNGNVYNTEDIMNNIEDPRIIGKVLLVNNVYTIPELGIM